MIKFAKPLIGDEEKKAVANALGNDRLTEGPLVEQFEHDFGEMFGGYAVAVSSCTAALHLAGMTLEHGEISVPAMTHAATALAMEAAGHNVKFYDCKENGITWGCGVSVDFMGQEAPHGLIEDAATALHLKEYGPIACFSFYPAKVITTGEGGMVLCRDRNLAEEIRRMRAFGKIMPFDVIEFGLNYRMSEINAAIGIEQLKKLPSFIERRRENEIALRVALKGMEVIGNNYALSVLVPDGINRDTIRDELLKAGVETSVYYPVPVPKLSYFKESGSYPNAERISSKSITLSVGPHLTPEDMVLQGVMVRELCLSADAASAQILPFNPPSRRS
jgi:dTDP-4-amino-4,6-dideoxygalactose transaminase